MRFGLLACETTNLGDEIQAIAARRFLPRIDCLVPREALDRNPGGEGPVRLILNGWLLHRPRRWPPHHLYDALPVSMHLSNRRPSRWRVWQPIPAEAMLSGQGRDWFRRNGPVGARDAATLRLLRQQGIDAYESGCLTLTLPRAAGPRSGEVVACDLPPEALAALRRMTRRPPLVTSHCDAATTGFEARMAKARALLDRYARARAVVTTRLHCALPCLALGTPVLFLPVEPDRGRQGPGLALAHTAELADFIAGRAGFDPEEPPPNPTAHLPFAAALAQRCQAFAERPLTRP